MKKQDNSNYRYITTVIFILMAVVITVFATGCTQNQNQENLEELMDVFSDTISDHAKSDIIETKSVYGKLNGNGNLNRF